MARGRKSTIKKSAEDFKRPNGKGCVLKLSGNRRKPYAVKVTTGIEFDESTMKARQVQKYLGYFETKDEAEKCLAEYTLNPYDIGAREITFADVYKLWSPKHFANKAHNTILSYTSAYAYCKDIHNVPMYQLKTAQLQSIVDACEYGSATKGNIKVLMSQIFDYCMQNDIVTKNYAKYITYEISDPTIDRIPFTREEVAILWEHSDQFDYAIMLILLYTGMRVNELLLLPRECCNLQERSLDIKKAKTKSSIRKVPIHDMIYPLVERFYNENGTNLIWNNGVKVMYNNFVSRNLTRINKLLESEHRFHDTRHTFISQARECNIDYLTLKRIVGHADKSITEKVYTHIEWKRVLDEVNKLEY